MLLKNPPTVGRWWSVEVLALLDEVKAMTLLEKATLEGVEVVAPALLKDTKAPAPPEVPEES